MKNKLEKLGKTSFTKYKTNNIFYYTAHMKLWSKKTTFYNVLR